jgi:hypothetical protein
MILLLLVIYFNVNSKATVCHTSLVPQPVAILYYQGHCCAARWFWSVVKEGGSLKGR